MAIDHTGCEKRDDYQVFGGWSTTRLHPDSSCKLPFAIVIGPCRVLLGIQYWSVRGPACEAGGGITSSRAMCGWLGVALLWLLWHAERTVLPAVHYVIIRTWCVSLETSLSTFRTIRTDPAFLSIVNISFKRY